MDGKMHGGMDRGMNGAMTVAGVLRHAGAHLRAHRKMVAMTVVALLVVQLIGFPVLAFAVLCYAQYELSYEMLADDDLLPAGYRQRRLLAVVGVQILTGLAVMAGWLLFVLPGLYLMLRLSLAVPALIAEEAGVAQALAISWRRLRGQLPALLGAYMLAVLPMLLLWTAVAFAVRAQSLAAVATLTLAAIGTSGVTLVYTWCIAAAAYAATRRDAPRLEQVFA